MAYKRVFHVCVECDPIHVDNCPNCFGYGFHKGTEIPVAAREVKTLTECDPCPVCVGTVTNDALYRIPKEGLEFPSVIYSKETTPGTEIHQEPIFRRSISTEESVEIEIAEIKKQVLKKGGETSYCRITFRANGELLFQEMNISNDLPDDVLKQLLRRIAQKRFTQRMVPKRPTPNITQY
jgi:hypothetical protein